MCSFFRLPFIAVFNLLLAHAQADDLFALASTDSTLNVDWLDDANSLWSSDDSSLDLVDPAANSMVGDFGSMSDADSFSNADDLFVSDPVDLTALPACGSEGGLTSDALQARDVESCTDSEQNLKLPVELFQDPVGFLRDKIRVPPVGQTNPPSQDQGSQENEERPSADTPRLEPDEEQCPTDKFGPANTPVCANPYTGYITRGERSLEFSLVNAIPCMCSILRFAFLHLLIKFVVRDY